MKFRNFSAFNGFRSLRSPGACIVTMRRRSRSRLSRCCAVSSIAEARARSTESADERAFCPRVRNAISSSALGALSAPSRRVSSRMNSSVTSGSRIPWIWIRDCSGIFQHYLTQNRSVGRSDALKTWQWASISGRPPPRWSGTPVYSRSQARLQTPMSASENHDETWKSSQSRRDAITRRSLTQDARLRLFLRLGVARLRTCQPLMGW